jgi:hypothetical protein
MVQSEQMLGMGGGKEEGCPNPPYSFWFGDTGRILQRLLEGKDASPGLGASSGGKDAPASQQTEMDPPDAPVGDDAAKGPDAWVCFLPASPSSAPLPS